MSDTGAMKWTAGKCRACGKITGPWPGHWTFRLAKLHRHKSQAMWNAVVTDKGRRACRAALIDGQDAPVSDAGTMGP